MQKFPDRNAALFWLMQFKSDPLVMADLRCLVSESDSMGISLWHVEDDGILQDLAWLLSSGVLHVHRVPAPSTAWRAAEKQSAPEAPAAKRASPASRPPAQASNPKKTEEPDTFSSQTDGAATAAALRDAAASGVPFCEECAKAAAARKAA